ncbi:MAG: hypothetical protein U0T73_06440 [Chitinophagales bacterium]
MDENALRNRLIVMYRDSIARRYDYNNIKKDPKLPKALKKEEVHELRDFFLEHLYAAPENRARLDKAFAQLESYVSNPAKVWGILGNLAGALLQFGMHFPNALKAGMATLETHHAARRLENGLLKAAQQFGYDVNMTDEQFQKCLATLPVATLEKFIGDLSRLFMVISDTVMLDKTLQILHNVLERMKKKPDLYGTADTEAIQLGIDILLMGKNLLGKYDAETKKQLLEFIQHNELRFIESIPRL